MNLIVRCPNCNKTILVKAGDGYSTETVTAQRKECTGCLKTVEVQVRVSAKIHTPEAANKG